MLWFRTLLNIMPHCLYLLYTINLMYEPHSIHIRHFFHFKFSFIYFCIHLKLFQQLIPNCYTLLLWHCNSITYTIQDNHEERLVIPPANAWICFYFRQIIQFHSSLIDGLKTLDDWLKLFSKLENPLSYLETCHLSNYSLKSISEHVCSLHLHFIQLSLCVFLV